MSTTPEGRAAQMLAALWDGRLPVDVKAIARHAGVQVKEVQGLDVSGVLSIDGAAPTIQVNSDEPSLRQRFTIAHELGHFFLGHLTRGRSEFRDPKRNYTMSNDNHKERDANRFAAAVLMPGSAVKAVIMRMKEANIETLAEVFKVSEVAMSIRLKSLGVIPVWA